MSSLYVKNVPVRDRPKHLHNLFGDECVVIGDFSSFECHMRGEFAKVVNYTINHLLGPRCDPNFRKMLNAHMLTFNETYYRSTRFRAQTPQTLMSGAVWTSLGNAILSSFLILYLRLRDKYPEMHYRELVKRWSSVKMCAEGDDTISLGGAYNTQLISQLGLKLKSKVLPWYGAGDFCGITKTRDVDDVMTDPVKVLCNFFLMDVQQSQMKPTKCDGLMRAKALSYYYQYSKCPVVGELAWCVLKRTAGRQVCTKNLSYHRDLVLREALSAGKFYKIPPVVDPRSRENFYNLYGVSPAMQIKMEMSFIRWLKDPSYNCELPDQFLPYQVWSENHVSTEKFRLYARWHSKTLPDPRILQLNRTFNLNAFLSFKTPNPTPRLVYFNDDGTPVKFQRFEPITKPFMMHDEFLPYAILH